MSVREGLGPSDTQLRVYKLRHEAGRVVPILAALNLGNWSSASCDLNPLDWSKLSRDFSRHVKVT